MSVKSIKKLVAKKWFFALFLFVVVLVSYGQIFGMGIWKDDNAIFFKLAHINEPAGFFGVGILGQGPYRFSVTPYWFIYQLIGYKPLWIYYLLIWSFYFLNAYLVYKVFSKIISPTAGKVASFLFAAGFIASDGFYWLANSMIAQTSMVADLLILLFYHLYRKQKKIIFYLLALGLYWMVSFLVPLRNYYFGAVFLIFELIHTDFENLLRSLKNSAVRLIPFILVFYFYNLANLDPRSASVGGFLTSLIGGKIYFTQGFVSSVASLVVPDWVTFWLFDHFAPKLILVGFFLVVSTIIYLLFKKKEKGKITAALFIVTAFLWIIFSKTIYSTPLLVLTPAWLFIIRLGGLLILLSFALFIILSKELKNYFLFFSFWFVVSVVGYTIYEPTVYFGTTHRYFTHSVIPLAGVLAIIYIAAGKKGLFQKLTRGIIILWGVTNLVSSAVYQNRILQERSIPVRNFYNQLKGYVSKINTGDVFYFNVAKNVQPQFDDAFKVSSMPNETAIAWRYGVDRSDLKLFVDFTDFVSWIDENNLKQEQIHTYYYSINGLIDTSDQTWNFLNKVDRFENVEVKSEKTADGLIITPNKPLVSYTPIEVELTLTGKPLDAGEINFPYVSDISLQSNKVAASFQLRQKAFDYQKQKNALMRNASVKANSVWFADVAEHTIDGNSNTVWRSDRLLWGQEHQTDITLDLGTPAMIGKFVWFNAYSNNSPTSYTVEVSSDGQAWQEVYSEKNQKRIDPDQMQVVNFNPQRVRFTRLRIFSTLNSDSPGISEVWVVPAGFEQLDIRQTEEFLSHPFGLVPDKESYVASLNQVNYSGDAGVYWFDNRSNEWTTAFTSKVKLIYDFAPRVYRVYLPAEGTIIERLKLGRATIPGEAVISSIRYRHLNLNEILNYRK